MNLAAERWRYAATWTNMTSESTYVAFELPAGVDPDSWARALLAAVDHEIAIGARKPNDRPRVYIASQSTRGPDHPAQIIAEPSAYRAMVAFDMRKFEADELGRRDLPPDAVEVTTRDLRPGRVFGFPDGLWRVSPFTDGARSIEFTNVDTGDRRLFHYLDGEVADAASLERLYLHEWYRLFKRAEKE
jgi:hypothetical protein